MFKQEVKQVQRQRHSQGGGVREVAYCQTSRTRHGPCARVGLLLAGLLCLPHLIQLTYLLPCRSLALTDSTMSFRRGSCCADRTLSFSISSLDKWAL